MPLPAPPLALPLLCARPASVVHQLQGWSMRLHDLARWRSLGYLTPTEPVQPPTPVVAAGLADAAILWQRAPRPPFPEAPRRRAPERRPLAGAASRVHDLVLLPIAG
mgnify:CR=1 FL=1